MIRRLGALVFRFERENLIRRASIESRSLTMNILRSIFAVLAIVLLIVSTVSTLHSHYVQFAILPLVCFFFGFLPFQRFELDEVDSAERTAAFRLLAARAPPLS